jgi:Putative zinc-finger
MKVLTCAATRRRLHAYHDEELSIPDQIAVSAHLEWCDPCAASFAELRAIHVALRAAAPGRSVDAEEMPDLYSSVVSRLRAENTQSIGAQLREMFEDMHFVYAGVGAAAATAVCVIIMLSMMRFANNERPGSNHNPVVVDAGMLMPRPLESTFFAPDLMPFFSPEITAPTDDAVYTLSGVVTLEGRFINPELHQAGESPMVAGSSEARAVEHLMDSLSNTRFEPARIAGLPVAVNIVWMVAHTTVRASKGAIDLATTPVKKRRADIVLTPEVRAVSL